MIKPGQTLLVKANATNGELQRAIEAVIPQATKQAAAFASRYKGKDEMATCKNIFDYLKNNINYKADGNNQQVRLPSGLMRTKQGDCKSYSVFTSAVLSNLGIPHKLLYAAYDPKDKTPTHIYVMTDSGCIIDAVYGKFNAEKKPTFKKYKKMNISYIAGVRSRRKIGRSCNTGYAGIGGIDTGKTWAEKLGIWKNLPLVVTGNFYKNLVNPLYVSAREVIKILLRKNAGGLATALNKTFEIARADNSTPEFKKYRDLEIKWLQKGGNPDELRVAFQDGSKKTPVGPYLNKLLKMQAGGYNPNPAQWVGAAVNGLFGKKYNEVTGEITGNSTGIGATQAELVATVLLWLPVLKEVVAIVRPNDITTIPDGTNTGGDGTNSNGGGAAPKSNTLLPILLIGGAAAAYFILKPGKK